MINMDTSIVFLQSAIGQLGFTGILAIGNHYTNNIFIHVVLITIFTIMFFVFRNYEQEVMRAFNVAFEITFVLSLILLAMQGAVPAGFVIIPTETVIIMGILLVVSLVYQKATEN